MEKLKAEAMGLPQGKDLYEIFQKIQNRAVVCTSNLGDGGNETIIKGLVSESTWQTLKKISSDA